MFACLLINDSHLYQWKVFDVGEAASRLQPLTCADGKVGDVLVPEGLFVGGTISQQSKSWSTDYCHLGTMTCLVHQPFGGQLVVFKRATAVEARTCWQDRAEVKQQNWRTVCCLISYFRPPALKWLKTLLLQGLIQYVLSYLYLQATTAWWPGSNVQDSSLVHKNNVLLQVSRCCFSGLSR